ncbi:MAG TPA: RNA 2',3'-cyclic phosphodiesterase [Peptococcaceae bacterium]|nr:RNA 2',3'-cyclic phosphodiesterase [Peptococcaceae bacterium]HBI26880.1 RNA 2',3'-cyclic phosphodiesterase [Peptococcaceae bacterium]
MLNETRSFIAVLLPSELKRDIYQFTAPLRQSPLSIKWVEEENYHLTMKFLGSCSAIEINKASNFLRDLTAERKPFKLQCGEVMVFPNWHRPRVISLSLTGDTEILKNLWYEIEIGLASKGFPEEKRKRFNPHITLGRLRSENSELRKMIEGKACPVTGKNILVWDIRLMASKLTPQGPQYTTIESFSFRKTL